MNVKIDTKEKFVVISPLDPDLTANMTEDLSNLLRSYMQKDIPHIIFNMSAIQNADEKACEMLADLQQSFYENNCSFVFCEIRRNILDKLDQLAILEILNLTPTESEAGDIVQMEEIERELLGGED
jgi:anti-anti-sigma regulatory factor